MRCPQGTQKKLLSSTRHKFGLMLEMSAYDIAVLKQLITHINANCKYRQIIYMNLYCCSKIQSIIKNTVNRCTKFTKLSTFHCKNLSSVVWMEEIGFKKNWCGANGTNEQTHKKILYILKIKIVGFSRCYFLILEISVYSECLIA